MTADACRATLLSGTAQFRAEYGPSACAVPFVDHVLAGHDNTTYGHVWSPIYSFFTRFVQHPAAVLSDRESAPRGALVDASQTRRCSAFAIPAIERRRGQLVYTELATLLSNASLPIVRAAWVPVCFKSDDACCAGAPSDNIVMHSVWPWTQTTEQTLALRAHVATALSLPRAARASVVYVSSQHAISGRHIEREPWLIAKLNATARRLQLDFTVLTPEIGYVDELRAFGGAKFAIALFGSALHNCRFMAPGATVIELHGALGNDFRHGGYWHICSCDLGLNYVGVRTTHAVPRVMESGDLAFGPDPPAGTSDADAAHWRRRHNRYQLHADVDSHVVANALERAARGELASLAREYASDLRVFNNNSKARACFLSMTDPDRPRCPTQRCVGKVKDR